MTDLFLETKLLSAKPIDIPMDPSLKISTHVVGLLEDFGQYMKLGGKLIYLILFQIFLLL